MSNCVQHRKNALVIQIGVKIVCMWQHWLPWMNGSWDAYLASPADFAGMDDIITNLEKEREPGIEIIECTPSSVIITSQNKELIFPLTSFLSKFWYFNATGFICTCRCWWPLMGSLRHWRHLRGWGRGRIWCRCTKWLCSLRVFVCMYYIIWWLLLWFCDLFGGPVSSRTCTYAYILNFSSQYLIPESKISTNHYKDCNNDAVLKW